MPTTGTLALDGLGGFVPGDHGDAGVCGRVAFHGNRRKTRRFGRPPPRPPCRLSPRSGRRTPARPACLSRSAFQRLLRAASAAQLPPAIDRASPARAPVTPDLPFPKNFSRLRVKPFTFSSPRDVPRACQPSHRYGPLRLEPCFNASHLFRRSPADAGVCFCYRGACALVMQYTRCSRRKRAPPLLHGLEAHRDSGAGWHPAAVGNPMPLVFFQNTGKVVELVGQTPVCAGPPGPALRSKNQVLATDEKPARGRLRDEGVRPTIYAGVR